MISQLSPRMAVHVEPPPTISTAPRIDTGALPNTAHIQEAEAGFFDFNHPINPIAPTHEAAHLATQMRPPVRPMVKFNNALNLDNHPIQPTRAQSTGKTQTKQDPEFNIPHVLQEFEVHIGSNKLHVYMPQPTDQVQRSKHFFSARQLYTPQLKNVVNALAKQSPLKLSTLKEVCVFPTDAIVMHGNVFSGKNTAEYQAHMQSMAIYADAQAHHQRYLDRLITHETAHALDHALKQNDVPRSTPFNSDADYFVSDMHQFNSAKQADLQLNKDAYPSNYARSSNQEFFAEAVTWYDANRHEMRQLLPHVAQFLDTHYAPGSSS
jgi:hypothetical protein